MSYRPSSGLTSAGLKNLNHPSPAPKFEPSSGITIDAFQEVMGLRRGSDRQDPETDAKTLDTSDRKSLPKTAFVFPAKAPGSGSYPIPDLAHARNALARSSGKPEEAAVKKAVYAKFPQLRNAS